MKTEVLYHDNHLLALNKPAGLLTQPDKTGRENLEGLAKAFVKKIKNKPGNVFLHAVHRLDRAVSGAVLFACTDKALSRLNADMRMNRFTKIYCAVVSGSLPAQEGSLRHFLLHGDHRAEAAGENTPGARECLLDYRVITGTGRTGSENMPGQTCTQIEIQLHTGRYHQIRAQLADIGCPVLGDQKYGSGISLPGGGIALHHAKLVFTHPVSKKVLTIEAPVPANWNTLVSGL